MAIHTDGWPAVEGMVVTPQRDGGWPLATQAVLIPFKDQERPAPVNIDILQIVLVPRAAWERLTAYVPTAVLRREGVLHG